MKIIKYLKGLPKAVEIFYNLKTFNHVQSLLKTMVYYSYGIAHDARMTCKFYGLHIEKGQIRLNISFSFCLYISK